MEYFLGILNRTYLVSGFNGGIGGARVGGLVSNPVVLPSDQAENPQTFVDTALSSRYKSVSFDSAKFLELDGANFFYAMHDVASISTNMARKWGMGNVRYSGRIFITLSSGKTREFILLGSQDVQGIADRLRDLMLLKLPKVGKPLKGDKKRSQLLRPEYCDAITFVFDLHVVEVGRQNDVILLKKEIDQDFLKKPEGSIEEGFLR